MCWCGDMKHNDSSEKNKYGMLARRHDAINTNKFQSFANTIICIFGRKQFMVQLALDDDVPSRYHRAPPHCYDCKQQNCEDWFIWSCGLCSGWLLVIGAVYSCSQCSDHASLPRCWWWPLTSDDGNKQSDGWDCEQFSASHPVLTQCNPLLPLSLLLSDHLKSWCSVHLKVWFLVITRRLTRRGTHKCPMGPINCWYPQSQSQPPPKRSITTHNLSLWKLAKNGATIYTTVNTDILQQQTNIYSWVPSTNPAQNLCAL